MPLQAAPAINIYCGNYTDAKRSGTLTFQGLPYGDYEVRGYYNNDFVIKAKASFRIGNVATNIAAKTTQRVYKPYEKVAVNFSGFPGNNKDWISIAAIGSADDKYAAWSYTNSKQSGTIELSGVPEGEYEIRAFFNDDGKVRVRYPFTVSKTATTAAKLGRTELSSFYAGMNSLGLCWGMLGSDIYSTTVISFVQTTLPNAITAIQSIPCLDFDVNKIRQFSSRLSNLTQTPAVNEIAMLKHSSSCAKSQCAM